MNSQEVTELNTLVPLILNALPSIISLIQTLHGVAHPSVAAPTDTQVVSALQTAAASTLAKDATWQAQHPSA